VDELIINFTPTGMVPTRDMTPHVPLAAFLSVMPAQTTWALAGIGRHQLDAALLAIATGGHVRVGLEDNIWFDRRRTRLATNAELVARVAAAAEPAERPLSTPAQTRERLGLPVVVRR
jgi:3-keto-5-aminohexanoate cleavage enzyme